MAMTAPGRAKIPTDSPQPVRRIARRTAGQAELPTEFPQPGRSARRAGSRAKKTASPSRPKVLAAGSGRDSARGGEVIELECGVTVYPPRSETGRWRAVWYEAAARQQCEAPTEEKLAPKLEKIAERLQADAPSMRRPGADLIAYYLDPDRLPVTRRWSRKHADTQRRLCDRYAAPVIAAVTRQDIKTEHTQKIVNAAPTSGEGDRVHRMISALVTAGIEAGFLASPRLARVHWQAGDRALPAPAVSVAGESGLWVDPAEMPSGDDVARLGQALRAGARGDRDELMAHVAAYSGLRWGEIAALTIAQVGPAARVITVDRKVVEVGGRLFLEAPKNRKFRRTIYPRRTPGATRWPSGSLPASKRPTPSAPSCKAASDPNEVP